MRQEIGKWHMGLERKKKEEKKEKEIHLTYLTFHITFPSQTNSDRENAVSQMTCPYKDLK